MMRALALVLLSGVAFAGVSKGQRAPDFSLPMLHGDRSVKLSDEYRHKPVVLVFGSYT